MRKAAKEKRVRTVPIWMGILVFVLAFGAGVASKFAIQPGWAKEYSVAWSDELGTKAEMWKCFPGCAKREMLGLFD